MVDQPSQQFTQAHLIEGHRFSATAFSDSVAADGGTLSLLIDNPSDSGVWILLDPPIVRNQRTGELDVVKNPTIDDAGTDVEELNKNFAHPDNSQVNASQDATISGGTSFGPKFAPGGGTGNVGGSASIGAAGVATPGDTIFLEYTNTTLNSGPASLDNDWTELRASFFPPTP